MLLALHYYEQHCLANMIPEIQDRIIVYFNYLSVPLTRYHDQKQLMQKKVYFALWVQG